MLTGYLQFLQEKNGVVTDTPLFIYTYISKLLSQTSISASAIPQQLDFYYLVNHSPYLSDHNLIVRI